MNRDTLMLFAGESNRIEGINEYDATVKHCLALESLLSTDRLLHMSDVDDFVYAVQPNARLRNVPGLDVRVGNHYPPRGGPKVMADLVDLLRAISTDVVSPFHAHRVYETLHPYTDGNGRSGRALWLWQMHKFYKYEGQLLFLHKWYYQSLDNSRP